MKASRIVLALLVAAIAAGGWYTFNREANTGLLGSMANLAGKGGSIDGAALQKGAGNPLEEAAGLAIKGINLFQGDKGIELWRLKASWAHMSQEGEVIDVERPVVHYLLGDVSEADPGTDMLDVQSEKGRISDNQRFLTLWDDVVITRLDNVITSPRMNYDANKRTMTFPEGASLESPTASGTATVFVWNLQTNEMHGSEGVTVILKPRDTLPKETPPEQPASRATE